MLGVDWLGEEGEGRKNGRGLGGLGAGIGCERGEAGLKEGA